MTKMPETIPTPLAPLVQRFFTERLSCQLGASSNTIASYRDTFRKRLFYPLLNDIGRFVSVCRC